MLNVVFAPCSGQCPTFVVILKQRIQCDRHGPQQTKNFFVALLFVFIASFFSSDADGHRAWFGQGRDRGDQQVGKAGKEVEEILTRIKF